MKVFLLQALHVALTLLILFLFGVSSVPMAIGGLLAKFDDWLGMREVLAKAEQRTAKERKA